LQYDVQDPHHIGTLTHFSGVIRRGATRVRPSSCDAPHN